MADKPKKKRKLKEAEAVEVHAAAWERFESTVKKLTTPQKSSKAEDQKRERTG